MGAARWKVGDVNLETPISRLAACNTPIGRLAFPGFTSNLAAEYEPQERRVEENDGSGQKPAEYRRDRAIREFAHFGAIAGKLNQGHNCKRQLEAQNYLAQDEQRSRAPLAQEADDDRRRNNGHRPRNQPPQPGLQSPMQKPLHNNLPGERSRERGVLP